MPDNLKFFFYGIAALILCVVTLVILTAIASWQYRECLQVGHSENYCAVMYPMGSR